MRGSVIEGADGQEGKSPDSKRITFTYADMSGCVRNGKTTASADADLFFFEAGNSFPLRYNPRKPERYFVPGVYSPSGRFVVALIFFAVASAGLIKLILMYSPQ